VRLDYIDEFVVLAKTGNYQRAANILYISQSSLSKHIKSMETELGSELFLRTTRRIELSPFGTSFLPYAEQISALNEDFHREMMLHQEKSSGRIVISMLPMESMYRITDAVIQFQKENPKYHVDIIEGDSEECRQMLRDGKCDLSFVRDLAGAPKDDAGFYIMPYMNDPMVAMLPKSHPLASRKSVRVEELKGNSFILLQQKTLAYHICVSLCREAGFEPRIAFTVSHGDTLADLVNDGMGISMLTMVPATYLLKNNSTVVEISPKVNVEVRILYRQETLDNPAASALLHFIEQHLHARKH
jgi:DNA-binding transcriptional LysR family regulator